MLRILLLYYFQIKEDLFKDFFGAWNDFTGHNAPLYEHSDNAGTYYTVNFVVNYWLSKGMPSSKIVLGLGNRSYLIFLN